MAVVRGADVGTDVECRWRVVRSLVRRHQLDCEGAGGAVLFGLILFHAV